LNSYVYVFAARRVDYYAQAVKHNGITNVPGFTGCSSYSFSGYTIYTF